MSDEKYVGAIAAAKNAALTKAVLDKKLDKTGGTITGSLKVDGIISAGMSLDLKSGIDAGGCIHSEESLLAPALGLYNGAKETSVSIDCSGDNAAKITSLSSDGKSHYARLAVGTPTGDNDAATKAYVDAKVDTTVYVDFWLTGSEDVYDKDFKVYVEEIAASQTFDAIFDSIKAGNKTIARLYSDESKSELVASSVDADISGDKTLGTINFSFLSAGTVNVGGFSFIGENITLIKTSSDTGIFLVAGATVLPVPNSDGTDNGKVPTINGTKWELKTPITADAVLYTAQTLTAEQKQQARKNIEAADSVTPTISGPVSLCPSKITDSNDAAHVTTTRAGGDDYTVTLDGGPENWPVRVAGIRTPTDAQTNYAANVAYVKAKIAEVAASGGVDVDNALSATSTNPVQNKVVTAALTGKAGTAVATQSINGLMSKADKTKLDGIAAGANKTDVDSSLSGESIRPVQNRVVKSALDGKLDKTGGTLTGNLTGKYIAGTWLQTTEATDLGRAPGKIAVLDDSGWVYYRTPDELLADIGAATVSAMLDKAYPVGSIYMSVNSTNPKTLFGGTWVQIKDRFLLAAGTTYKAGATGGEATHTLTTSEMPSHNHAVYYPNAGAADHSAPGNYPDGPSDSTYYAVGSYTSSAGGGGAHNNMPPYLSVYVWKRTA